MSTRKKSGLGRQAGALFPHTPPTDDLFSSTAAAPPAPALPANAVQEAAPSGPRSSARPDAGPGASGARSSAAARAESAIMPEPVLPEEGDFSAPPAAQGVSALPGDEMEAQAPAPRRPGRPPAPVGPGGPKKIKSTSLRVEEGLYRRFRQICLAKDVTVQVAIEEAIRNYIEDAE